MGRNGRKLERSAFARNGRCLAGGSINAALFIRSQRPKSDVHAPNLLRLKELADDLGMAISVTDIHTVLAKKWVRFVLLAILIASIRGLGLKLLELGTLVGRLVGFGILALTMIPEFLSLALVCGVFGISTSDVMFNYLYAAAVVLGSIIWAWYLVYRTKVLEILLHR